MSVVFRKTKVQELLCFTGSNLGHFLTINCVIIRRKAAIDKSTSVAGVIFKLHSHRPVEVATSNEKSANPS